MGVAEWCGSVGMNEWVDAGAARGASDTIVPWRLSVQWRSTERCNGGGPSRLVLVLVMLLGLVQLVGCPRVGW